MTKISVIIVTWNVAPYIRACLNALVAASGISLEILVIDNASHDNTYQALELWQSDYPQVRIKLVRNEKNLGFAAANNQGIKQASGDYILLLNPDTEIAPDALAKMVDFFEDHPACAVAGCRLLNQDGTTQPSVRHFPTLFSQALILLKLHRLFPRLAALEHYGSAGFDYAKTQIVDQVMGAFFMLPKKTLETIGLLDENFFIWFEEVDYCKRVALAKQQVWYVSEATCVHHGGRSFAQELPVTKQRRFNATMRQYFLKHHGPLSAFMLTCLHPISLGLAFVSQLFQRHE